ncbi:hypothetical protein EP1X_07940 [Thermococcus sp. EP1]|uniref:DUF257 family protein n=1 Tax=Thermococcus sp. EP1 TaxID=1591054 RepID=UPI0006DACDF0|nr:DUF257 family protein [Thermococcus sp. EP1]KPU62618.1 hypothetical protein EP1X_07940 [Thermococcus sp. EP1]
MEQSLHKIWNSIKYGETVLIEHDSVTSPVLGFYHLISWAREKGNTVVVDDVLDTLYMYKIHLELAGFDTSILDELKVIKAGGRLEVGQILGRISLKEPSIRESEYRRIFKSISPNDKVVNPVLGFEKLLLIADSKQDTLTTMNTVLSFTGTKRIAFYFITTDLLEKSVPYALLLFENMATTVIKVTKEDRRFSFNVVKSVNNEIDGMEVMI